MTCSCLYSVWIEQLSEINFEISTNRVFLARRIYRVLHDPRTGQSVGDPIAVLPPVFQTGRQRLTHNHIG